MGREKSFPSCVFDCQGVEGSQLDAALAEAEKQGLALHAVIVLRHGYVVKEKHYPPFDADSADEIYSCTKSFVSALVPVLGFFPQRKFENVESRKKAMRLEDLLTMSSGLQWVEGDP
jgi:CubicO group peptidase (beta-lactamase class C family)